MAGPGTPTLDQLRIFLAIADTGSFAAAGRRLNRAVSVISYGIVNLEQQLGLTLFDREGSRKPVLTTAGRALLAEARATLQGIDGLRAKVKGLLDGLEAEVDLAVDVMLPADRLGKVLRAFATEFSDGVAAPACRGAGRDYRDGARSHRGGRHFGPLAAGRGGRMHLGRIGADGAGRGARSSAGAQNGSRSARGAITPSSS